MVELKDVIVKTQNRNFSDFNKEFKNYHKIALFLSLFGIIYTLVELVLLQFHTSICSSQGCELVGHFALFGEGLIIAIGIAYFALLSLSIFYRYKDRLLISLGLAVEGYLLGFQLFIIHSICYFCLGVFLIIFVISVLYLLSGKYKVTDYSYLAGILLIVYLIHPPYLNISGNGNYLFYSPTCPHCHKTIAYLKDHKIPFKPINANECQAFLNTFGINQVPCLVKKENNDSISIIVGEENIESYFTQLNSQTEKIEKKAHNTVDIGSINVTAKRIDKPVSSVKSAVNSTVGKKADNSVSNESASTSDSTNFLNYDYSGNNSTQACTIGNSECK